MNLFTGDSASNRDEDEAFEAGSEGVDSQSESSESGDEGSVRVEPTEQWPLLNSLWQRTEQTKTRTNFDYFGTDQIQEDDISSEEVRF